MVSTYRLVVHRQAGQVIGQAVVIISYFGYICYCGAQVTHFYKPNEGTFTVNRMKQALPDFYFYMILTNV